MLTLGSHKLILLSDLHNSLYFLVHTPNFINCKLLDDNSLPFIQLLILIMPKICYQHYFDMFFTCVVCHNNTLQKAVRF